MADLRMVDLNMVMLVGRLTRDPELRYTPSGIAVATLPLAVSRFYKSNTGERKEEVLYINVIFWDKQAEFCEKNLSKGRPVLVEGRLVGREFETKDGQKRKVVEVRGQRIQTMDWAPQQGGAAGKPAAAAPAPETREAPAANANANDQDVPPPDDDIPF